jgi:hypothetical protein
VLLKRHVLSDEFFERSLSNLSLAISKPNFLFGLGCAGAMESLPLQTNNTTTQHNASTTTQHKEPGLTEAPSTALNCHQTLLPNS